MADKVAAAVAKKKNKWVEEEEEEEVLPSKTTGKGRAKEFRIRIPLRVKERKGLPRFGDAKEGEEGVTLPSRDYVQMEHPEDQLAELDDEKPSEAPKALEAKKDKYVAPGARLAALQGTSASPAALDGTETTIRVSNLTKAVTEDDLFGHVSRISLPRDADKVLQGYGYDHLIIKLEWAKPNQGGGGGGGGGMGFVSGYGQKLAQDTTEKVFYNSTRNS
eukprot:gene24483-29592_t